MENSTKIRNRIIIIVTSMILALICTTSYRLYKYKEMIRAITVQEPDLSKISDGEYLGECDLDLVYAKVKVVMNGGKIKDIRILEHRKGNGEKAEVIIDEIVNKQKLGVTVITGATASSKALMKAVECALEKN